MASSAVYSEQILVRVLRDTEILKARERRAEPAPLQEVGVAAVPPWRRPRLPGGVGHVQHWAANSKEPTSRRDVP